MTRLFFIYSVFVYIIPYIYLYICSPLLRLQAALPPIVHSNQLPYIHTHLHMHFHKNIRSLHRRLPHCDSNCSFYALLCCWFYMFFLLGPLQVALINWIKLVVAGVHLEKSTAIAHINWRQHFNQPWQLSSSHKFSPGNTHFLLLMSATSLFQIRIPSTKCLYINWSILFPFYVFHNCRTTLLERSPFAPTISISLSQRVVLGT